MSDDPNLVSAQFGSRPPSTGQARRVPFRIVVIGDFGLAPGRLHGFDDQESDAALASARPRLDLAVADHLGGGDRPLAVSLEIGALKDFSPPRLLESVPALAKALAARDSLRRGAAPTDVAEDLPGLGAGMSAPSAGEPAPAASAPPSPPMPSNQDSGQGSDRASSSDDPLDRLFDMVDPGGTGAPPAPASTPRDDPAKRAVSAFIGSMGGRNSAAAANGNGGATVEAERRLAAQLAAVLDAPVFQALETSWRGLRFLLRHSDRRAQCFVHVISASREEAADAARAILIDAADQQPAGLGLLVSAHEFGSGPGDTARLQALAEIGAEIQVPVVATAGADFVHGGEDLARHRDPETLFQDAAYAPWSSLRAKPVSRWLGLTVNRFRLRPAHDLVTERRLAFSEASGATAVGTPLEAGGAWLVAALAAESAAATGWPTELTGPSQVIDGLPLYGDDEADANVFAVAMALRPDAAASLANAGLIALVGQANRDIARLVRVPSVRSARSDPTGDLPRDGTFDFQLLVSRLIRQIEGNADLIFAAASPSGIRDAMEIFLAGLMGRDAEVSVALEEEQEGEQVLSIRVTTGRDILGGVTVNLDLPV